MSDKRISDSESEDRDFILEMKRQLDIVVANSSKIERDLNAIQQELMRINHTETLLPIRLKLKDIDEAIRDFASKNQDYATNLSLKFAHLLGGMRDIGQILISSWVQIILLAFIAYKLW